MQASVDAAQATLKQAQWQLAQTEIRAPVSGWVTNLTTRIGDYADTGKPLFALVDSHSFYVIGYFEETKLRHIREGAPAQITPIVITNVTGSRVQYRSGDGDQSVGK